MGSVHKIKNLLCHSCLAQQQLLKMVWHDLLAPTTMDLLHFREKDRVQARAYLGGLGRITTQPKITADQPSMPWKFQLNLFTCLKVIHDFQCHRQMDRHANSIQNESSTPYGCRRIFFYPVISTSLRNVMSERFDGTYFRLDKFSTADARPSFSLKFIEILTKVPILI